MKIYNLKADRVVVTAKEDIAAVKPTIYKVLPIRAAEAARDLLYQGKNVGKVVLKV